MKKKNKLYTFFMILFLIILTLIIPFILVMFLQKILGFDNIKSVDLNDLKTGNKELKSYNGDFINYKESKKIKTGLNTLTGLACDVIGNIYVTGDKKIFMVTNDYHYIMKIDLEENPLCITVNKNHIFVGFKTHVEVFSLTGSREKIWADFGSNAFVTSIKSGDNDIYICDAGNGIVMHYDVEGKLISIIDKKINGKESGFNVKSNLFDLAITEDNNLLITESGDLSIHKYKPNGEFIEKWKKRNDYVSDFIGCCNPSHIARMSDGTIVVFEKGIVRIKLYDESGNFRGIVAPDYDFSFNRISGLAVDNKDRILLLDPDLKIVRIYTKK